MFSDIPIKDIFNREQYSNEPRDPIDSTDDYVEYQIPFFDGITNSNYQRAKV